MSHLLSAVDRIICLLLGLALALGGLWAVLWVFEFAPARDLGSYYDADALAGFLGSQWYPVALAGTAVLAAVLSLWLLAVNLRRRRFNHVLSPRDTGLGEVSVALSAVARAVSDRLTQHPGVTAVTSTRQRDRGRPTMEWVVAAEPDVDLPALAATLDQTERDVRDALPGVEVKTRYLVHLRPVESA